MRGGERKGTLVEGGSSDLGVSSVGARGMGMLASSLVVCCGPLKCMPFGPPVPEAHAQWPVWCCHPCLHWKPGPAPAASGSQFHLRSEEESGGLDGHSAPPNLSTLFAALIELQLSVELGLECGRGGPLLGGGANLSLLPPACLQLAGLRVATQAPGEPCARPSC